MRVQTQEAECSCLQGLRQREEGFMAGACSQAVSDLWSVDQGPRIPCREGSTESGGGGRAEQLIDSMNKGSDSLTKHDTGVTVLPGHHCRLHHTRPRTQ